MMGHPALPLQPNYSNGVPNQIQQPFRGSGPGPVRGVPFPSHARAKSEMMGDSSAHGSNGNSLN